MMSSGGSMGVRYWGEPLRKSAAQAREMLLAEAAAKLGVGVATLDVASGRVVHAASGRSLGFGELAPGAARRPLPAEPKRRPASTRRYCNNDALRRLDVPPKCDGSATFSADFRRPGLLYACAWMTPVRGASVAKVDRSGLAGIKGIVDVVEFGGGVAVVATSSWAAIRGVQALRVESTKTPNDSLDSAAFSAAMREGLGAPTRAVRKDEGNFEAAKAAAARVVTADYEVPHLAHAAMETWSVTLERGADGIWQAWAPTQAQDRTRNGVARGLGVPPEQVRVHTLWLGGGFGRRLADDGIVPAGQVAKALGGRPVQFFWTRETEFVMASGRPIAAARLTGTIDAAGRITGLHVRAAGPSMQRSFAPGFNVQDLETFVDGQALQHLDEARYRFGALKLDYAMRHNHVPTGPWRSVGATQCAFFLECFVDELARALDKDPLALRRELLAHDPRALKVVETAAEKAGWGPDGRGTAAKPLPNGHALGIGYYESYGSLCAQVAEVSLEPDGTPRVHRIVCVLDCGEVVTPDGVRSQMEGGVIQSMSATLFEAATVANGAAVERNFDRYRLLRISEAPARIEAHIIRSGEKIGGVGEPPVPPTAPAIANAVARLTGKPVRRLPIVPPAA
jgi:isoquinoline 1-oxidoreductase beta subunit